MEKVTHRPYYDKGGHWERSRFRDDVTKIAKSFRKNYSPTGQLAFVYDQVRDQAYMLRRQMRRDPRDGRV